MNFVAEELADDFDAETLVDDIVGLDGETYREVKGRRTFRFLLNGKAYFAKVHLGVGWIEIAKNLLQLRLPVLGASNEYDAIRRLQQLNVETMKAVAFGSEGHNPAQIRSCLITESLEHTISIEELVFANKHTTGLKWQLLHRIGAIAKTLHENGVNHRDFYICHFLIPEETLESGNVDHLHLIDLHRAQLRSGLVPRRWREKDIAALLFSAADSGLTRTDLMRFIRSYSGRDYRARWLADRVFWRRVVKKAHRLYFKDHGRSSKFLRDLEFSR
jgi:heptose I phosphotransferase